VYLNDSVDSLPMIKGKYAEKLGKLGILTIRDLLTHFPRYHKDTSEVTDIADITGEGKYTIKGSVQSLTSIRIRGGRTLQKATLTDDTDSIPATWFNQNYLSKALRPNEVYLFQGNVKQRGAHLEIFPNNFEQIIEGREQLHLGRLSPQYALTSGISIKWIRNRLKYLLDRIDSLDIEDELNDLDKGLKIDEAIRTIHFPEDMEQFEEAKYRLGLFELTNLQLQVLQRKAKQKSKAPMLDPDSKKLTEFINSLPFELTEDQTSSIEEVIKDLKSDTPMLRLLEGDVGSGKTVVAVVASLIANLSGKQTVVLAPTLVLANQHYKTFKKFFEGVDIKVELVTGEVKSTEESKNSDVLIGTSAVLARKQDLITDLGLVIVDEQHRFGVRQREELLAPIMKESSKTIPHLLNMTATPIPRTLALAMFGDVEVSIINTKPKGRLPIKTFLVPDQKRNDSYEWIREQVKKGEQGYWICSLVSESEVLENKSAIKLHRELSKEIFPDLKIGLLHGQMKGKEKTQVMQDYLDKKYDILVSTTVIEVGIDVPNATFMVIEDSERFGLAQLHQIRGRVGRSDKQSWCFLYTNEEEERGMERLQYFSTHNDGMEIAEYDLKLRGPGEVYGTRQSGIPNLKIADITNLRQLKQVREYATLLLKKGIKHISLFSDE